MAFTLTYALGVVELHHRFGLPARARGLAYCSRGVLPRVPRPGARSRSRTSRGSFALGAIPIAIAWWHVSMFNGSQEAPFVPLADAAGLLAALALRPQPAPAVVLAVTQPSWAPASASRSAASSWALEPPRFVDDQREAIAHQALAAAALERRRSATSLETALADEQDARAALADALGVVERLRADAARGAVATDAELRDELDSLFAALSLRGAQHRPTARARPPLSPWRPSSRTPSTMPAGAGRRSPSSWTGRGAGTRPGRGSSAGARLPATLARQPDRQRVRGRRHPAPDACRVRAHAAGGASTSTSATTAPRLPRSGARVARRALCVLEAERRRARALPRGARGARQRGELRRRNLLASGGAEATASLPQAARGDAEREGPAA